MKKKRFAFLMALIAIVAVNSVVTMAAKRSPEFGDRQYSINYTAELKATRESKGFGIYEHTLSYDTLISGYMSDQDLWMARIGGNQVRTKVLDAEGSVEFNTTDRITQNAPYIHYSGKFKRKGWGLTSSGLEVQFERLTGGTVSAYCGD